MILADIFKSFKSYGQMTYINTPKSYTEKTLIIPLMLERSDHHNNTQQENHNNNGLAQIL